MIGLLDGFGLALFIPLLQLFNDKSESTSTDDLGGLSFLVDAIDSIGLPFTIYTVLLIIVVFFLLKGITKFSQLIYNVNLFQYFMRHLRFSNIDGLRKLNFKSFIQSDIGRIHNTMTSEVGRLSQAYRSYIQTIQAWIMVLVYVALAFFTNAQFAILVII